MPEARTATPSRRTVLEGALAAGVAGVGVGTAAPPAAAAGGVDSWLSDTSNYDGVVDRTGVDEVTVTVGAQANGGAFGFEPAAIRVDPGTTVVWKWTGKGGSHNVVAKDGSFESELVGESGHTFSYTFEEPGVTLYACSPHKMMGMKGAVVVGDVEVGGSSDSGGSGASSDSETPSASDSGTGTPSEAAAGATGGEGSGGAGDGGFDTGDGALLLLGGGVGAALSPLVFGLFLLLVGERGEEAPTAGREYGGADSARTDGGHGDGG